MIILRRMKPSRTWRRRWPAGSTSSMSSKSLAKSTKYRGSSVTKWSKACKSAIKSQRQEIGRPTIRGKLSSFKTMTYRREIRLSYSLLKQPLRKTRLNRSRRRPTSSEKIMLARKLKMRNWDPQCQLNLPRWPLSLSSSSKLNQKFIKINDRILEYFF